ncbi:hypothetical protein [Sulfurimonas sp.]|uniref:hypothetical protein n=1 Tax=Sulfurimonas sp. TaxID=2022749 RepID=UPI0035650F38
MNIEKLFKKAEKFFVLDEEEQQDKEDKKKKLKNSFEKKIENIKKKIKKADDSDEKFALKKQLDILIEFHEKLG